jgi:hypothetical protein
MYASLAKKLAPVLLSAFTAAGCSTTETVGGGIGQAAKGVWGDVTRTAGNTAAVVSEGFGLSAAPATNTATAPATSSKLHPKVVALINQKLPPAEAQKLVDIADPYVAEPGQLSSGQLSRKTRETGTSILNREIQKRTGDIPVVGGVLRSSGNNAQASPAREAQMAQMVINANNAAIKADEYESQGNRRAAEAQMRTASGQIDAATRAYAQVFGGSNSLEKRHTGRALESGVYNETTRQLNKVQPGGLPGLLDKVFK